MMAVILINIGSSIIKDGDKINHYGNDIRHQPPNIHLHTSKCCYFTGNFQQEFTAQFD